MAETGETCSLVIGASGQVGRHLIESLTAAGGSRPAVGTYSETFFEHKTAAVERLDLRDLDRVSEMIRRTRPKVLYLPAFNAHVDYCETHPEETRAINVAPIDPLVEAVNAIGAKLVYFSSDYVFDGEKGPYREDDAPNRISEYGRQKWAVEQKIQAHADSWVIIRTTGVYSYDERGKNFVRHLIDRLEKGESIRVPNDQIATPTYAPNLAAAATELGESALSGIYHVSGPDLVDRYRFALAAAEAFGCPADPLRGVPTEDLGQAAPRPKQAGLIVEKAQATLRTELIGYGEGLRRMAEAAQGPRLRS